MKREEIKVKLNSMYGKKFEDRQIIFHEEAAKIELINPSVSEMLTADTLLKVSAENNKLRFENAKLNEEIEKLKERMNRNMKIADKTVFGMRDTTLDLINTTADVLLHNRELREKVQTLEAEIKEMKTI